MEKSQARKTVSKALAWACIFAAIYLFANYGRWLDPDYRELVRLCKEEAQFFIKRKVHADGIVNKTMESVLESNLVAGNFRFYEFCKEKTRYVNARTLFPDGGCYRLTRIRRGQGNCHAAIEHMFSVSSIPVVQEFRKQHCVEVTKIDHPTARYVYEYIDHTKEGDETHKKFHGGGARIYDSLTQEVIAEYGDFSYTVSTVFPTSLSCYQVIDGYPTFRGAKLLENTILPNKDVEDDRESLY